jgi:hypothetical protein
LIQVHTVHRLDANAHESLCHLCDISILTDNLPVEIGTSLSPFAPKYNEHGLARLATQPFTLLVIEDPLNSAIDRLWLRFLMSPPGCRAHGNQRQDDSEASSEMCHVRLLSL